MEKKKKIFLVFGIILLVVILAIGVIFALQENQKKFKVDAKLLAELNQNSNLPAEYMEAYTKEMGENLKTKYEYIANYMSYDFFSDDVRLIYAGYPTDESDYRLNGITLLSDQYDVFGIKVGDKLADAKKILESKGYTQKEQSKFSKNVIDIEFEINFDENDEIVIEEITIHSESKYLGNRIY